MTFTLVLASVIIVSLSAMIVYSGHRIEQMQRAENVSHAKCLAHIAHYVGNEFAAKVLQAAADDYASPEGQYQLDVLIAHAQSRYTDQPIPSIWLNNRADELLKEVRI